jgi:alkylhydroperoxidase family enzyme
MIPIFGTCKRVVMEIEMTDFTLHTMETAPEAAKPLFEKSLKAFGMIPNLHATMAEAPALLDAYQQVHALFQDTSFNADELTVVWQTINVENNCHYCVPAHSAIAQRMGVDASINQALRDGVALDDAKLEALRQTTLAIVRNRGVLSEDEVSAFLAVGYGQQQLLEIVLGLAQKIMSNYTNHLAKTPIDEPFKAFA